MSNIPVQPPMLSTASSLDLMDALGDAACLSDRLPPPPPEQRTRLVEALPGVLAEFYGRLAAVPEYATLLGGPERIARLQRQQERYWRLLIEQPLDSARGTVVRHVAEVHWRLAIQPNAMILAYEFITRRLVERAALAPEERYGVLAWLSQITCIDLALAQQHLWQLQLDEAQAVEAELERAAATDPLTGLANRRLFAERLERALRVHARDRRPVGLLRLDVDHFKVLNDVFGHEAGDRVLVEIARRLAASVREVDTPARIGGDEFAVLVHEPAGAKALERLAARLLEVLARPVWLGRRSLRATVSIGWALAPDHASDAEGLLRAADAALYRAKRDGRQRATGARVARPHPLGRDWLDEFANSLKDGRVRFVYQPQVALEDGRLRGFEALVRWHHGEEPLTPDRFLGVVMRSAVASEFTDWSLDQAAAFAARLRREHGFNGVVAVNLCRRQLRLVDLPARVEAALVRHAVPAGMLEVEITEDVLMAEDDGAFDQVLGALREIGVRLALDDFGTGLSSLAALESCPIQTLKIDAGFVRRLGRTAQASAIVRAVCRLARAIEAETVAEGVEHPAQAQELRRYRCGFAQGWLYARPLAETCASAWCGRHLSAAARPAVGPSAAAAAMAVNG